MDFMIEKEFGNCENNIVLFFLMGDLIYHLI